MRHRRHQRRRVETRLGSGCIAHGCPKPARRPPLTPYCLLHGDRMRRTYTTSRLPTDRDLQRFRRPIADVLRRQRDSEAVHWACRLVTRDILNYRATTGITLDRTAERVLGQLRLDDVHPLDVIQRAAEVVALRVDGDPVLSDNPKAYRCALARFVIRLRREEPHVRRPRLEAPQLHYIGTMIDEVLGRFALALLEQVKRSQEEAKAFRGACDELATGSQRYINPIRHGRSHSRLQRPRRSSSAT